MTRMTNTSILANFRKEMGLDKKDATLFTETFQQIFEEALLRDKVVKISKLGTFKLLLVEARKSVDINTGEEIEIAEHYKLTFTPDTSLKEFVNQPLAHLETIELDDNEEVVQQSNLPIGIIEEKEIQEDPLLKLTEQALELKDILADIQGLDSIQTSDVEVETLLNDNINVENSESQDSSQTEVQEVIDNATHTEIQEEIQEMNSNELHTEIQEDKSEEISIDHQVETLEEKPIESAEDKIVKIENNKQSEAIISGQEAVAAINREDSQSNKKTSKAWIFIASFLFLAIIGLLFYQNRDFFNKSENIVEIKVDVVDSLDRENLLDQSTTDSLLVQDLISDTSATLVEQDLIENNIYIDKTSPIYSDKFSDIFNIKREHTEFIDTVVLNEGSRLTWISLKQYGHKDFWVYIYEANMDIVKNPNSIRIGTALRIPKLDSALIDANNPESIEYARYLHDVYVKK